MSGNPRMIFRNILVLLPALSISMLVAAQQPTQPMPGVPGGRQARLYSVNGFVSDAANHSRIEGAKVDLNAFNGSTVGTTFTGGNGEFEFDNVNAGSYSLTVEPAGYETATQQVQVMSGPVFGVEVEVRKAAEAGNGTPTRPKISVRELSIPHKAHDSMEKGLELLYVKSDYKGSLKQFERAIQEYPGYYEAFAEMGVAYMRLGDAANSEQSFRKSIDLSKEKYVDAFFLLASLFSESQRFSDAEPLARKAVELDSSSWQANAELAHALLGLDRADEAEASATAAVKLQPNNASLYLLLADVHTSERDYPSLLDDLNTYLKLAPTGPLADQARKQRDQLQQILSEGK